MSRFLPYPSYCKKCCNEHWDNTCLFQLWLSQGICPVVGLLGHMVFLFLVFKGIFTLFSAAGGNLLCALWQPRRLGWGGRWEGGSRGRGHVYTCGWFMLMYGRNQHSIVKQLSSNKKIFLIAYKAAISSAFLQKDCIHERGPLVRPQPRAEMGRGLSLCLWRH